MWFRVYYVHVSPPPRKCIMPVYLWADSVCYLRHTAATTTASSHTDRLRQTAVSAAEPHARRPFGAPSSYTSRVSVWPFKLAFLSCRTYCTHYFFIIIIFFSTTFEFPSKYRRLYFRNNIPSVSFFGTLRYTHLYLFIYIFLLSTVCGGPRVYICVIT